MTKKQLQQIIFKINTKCKSMGKCYAPEEMKSNCDKKIVNAHTVSKSSNLFLIARNNHVYDFYQNSSFIFKNEEPSVKQNLKGVNQASTFKIFCKKHDSELFKDFENNPLTLNSKHLFLILYRTVSQELYKKEVIYNQYKEYIEKFGDELAYDKIDNLRKIKKNTGIAIRDLNIIKKELDNDLLSGKFREVKSFILVLNSPIDIMSSGAFVPTLTLNNQFIFNLNDYSKNAPLLSINSLSYNDNKQSIIIFSWIPKLDNEGVCEKLINSLKELNDKDIIAATFNLIFKSIENIFISPYWFDELSESNQKLILYKINDITSNGLTLNDYKKLKDILKYNIDTRKDIN